MSETVGVVLVEIVFVGEELSVIDRFGVEVAENDIVLVSEIDEV